MSDDTDTTRWSLPGQMDVPRDELKVQLEVYDETILLRGFEDGANWVRTVSADAVASALTQHLGFSSGLLPKDTLWWSQGETGQVVALWRPPKVSWSSSARRAGRPGSTPPRADPAEQSSSSTGLPPSTSSATGGSVPAATRSPKRSD